MENTKVKLHHGIITNWQHGRGFGWIAGDGGGSHFAHVSVLQKNNVYEPQVGDRLLFELVPSRRKPGAFELGGHVERLNADGSRRVEAPRPARPQTLREAHEREEAAFARLAFVSKGPR